MSDITYRPLTLFDTRAIAELLRERDLTLIGSTNLWDSSVFEQLSRRVTDLEAATIGAFTTDDTLAGFEVLLDRADPQRADLWGGVAAKYCGRGIGSHLIAWALERAAAADTPTSVYAHVYERDAAGIRLLDEHGFAFTRSFYLMTRDLSTPIAPVALPDGFRATTYAEQPDLRTYVEIEADSFRDHWGWIETPFEEDLANWQHFIDTAPDFDPAMWWLAFHGDEPAAAIMTQTESIFGADTAWINSLGVRRPYRKRGLATALLNIAFRAYRARGAAAIALGVDASSLTNAVALYERAGMTVFSRRDTYEKRLPGR